MSNTFTATFTDGYTRTIAHPAIKTQAAAVKYAKDLEVWFQNPERTLTKVEPKQK
jgi:hypothetical protein